MIYYIYDASGNVIGLKYNDDIYYYEKNIQNDITGIMDDSFNLLATYQYDSWGNILSIKDTNGNTITDSTNIALVNPFRYRSYYYDSEIGMYYLNSRYYNSEWGRFINADGTIGANQDAIGNNLYAYVSNNPINNIDSTGTFSIKSILKNTAKAISSGISKAGKAIINVGKSVDKAIVNNFSAEAGVGTGAGVSVSPLGIQTRITTYKDKSWGIANGKTYSSITGNASAQIIGIGPTYQYEHPLPFPEDVTYWENDPYNTKTLLLSPYVKKSCSFDVPFANFSKNGIFIGIELEAHLGIGGHIRIGWDIK